MSLYASEKPSKLTQQWLLCMKQMRCTVLNLCINFFKHGEIKKSWCVLISLTKKVISNRFKNKIKSTDMYCKKNAFLDKTNFSQPDRKSAKTSGKMAFKCSAIRQYRRMKMILWYKMKKYQVHLHVAMCFCRTQTIANGHQHHTCRWSYRHIQLICCCCRDLYMSMTLLLPDKKL